MQKIFVSREAVKSALMRNAFLFVLLLLQVPWCIINADSYEFVTSFIFLCIFLILFYNKGNFYLAKIFAAIILSEQAIYGIKKSIGENVYTEWLSSLAQLPKEGVLEAVYYPILSFELCVFVVVLLALAKMVSKQKIKVCLLTWQVFVAANANISFLLFIFFVIYGK